MKGFSAKFFLCILLFISVSRAYGQGSTSNENICSDKIVKEFLQELNIPTTQHNEVKLIFSGHDKFEDLFAVIRQAKHHIHLEYFNFRNDSIANALFDLLGEKVKEGVEVRAMFDAFGNSSNNRPLKRKHLKAIRAKGIEIVKYDPIRFPYFNHVFIRDHRKIAVIDGRIAYTGGMNIADYYIQGLPEIGPWRDMHMRIEGEAVKYLQEIFLKIWNEETGQEVKGDEYFPTPSMRGNVELAIVDRAPVETPQTIRHAYAASIDAAQDHVHIINPYFVPTHRVRKSLKKALRRGIDVEIMVPAKSDIGFTPETGEYVLHKLARRGAAVYLYNGGFHHSKIMTVDNTFCTVGTANLNSRSLRFDYETNAFIFDKGVTQQLDDMFMQDKANSTLMTPQYWQNRSRWKRFVGWFGNLLTPFL